MDDRKWVFGKTKDLVGVNGIDPVRQGINPFRKALKRDRQDYGGESRSIGVFTKQNRSIESLVNRANAIRPYGILRHITTAEASS